MWYDRALGNVLRMDALGDIDDDVKVEEDIPSEALALVRAAQASRSAAEMTKDAFPVGTVIEAAYAGGEDWFPGKVGTVQEGRC